MQRNQIVYRQNEEANKIYIVKEGEFEVSRTTKNLADILLRSDENEEDLEVVNNFRTKINLVCSPRGIDALRSDRDASKSYIDMQKQRAFQVKREKS